MANPQQPELRRSEETPGLAPDSIEGELRARRKPGPKGNSGPVPPGNQAGASNGGDQDKPDLSKFAAKLGIDEPDPDGERASEAAQESVQDDPIAAPTSTGGLVDTATGLVRRSSKLAIGTVGLGVGAAAWVGTKVVRRVRNLV